MRIFLSRLVAVGVLLGLALVVAACSGLTTPSSSSATGTSSTSPSSAAASPAASPAASLASPSVTGSPVASPAASPTASGVSLAQAFANLSQQSSFVMKMTMTGASGIASVLPDASGTLVITTTRNNGNAHIVVANQSGGTLAQVWRVNGQQWVDTGSGPQQANANAAELLALTPIVNSPALMMQTFSGANNQYTVTGQQTVNGMQTTVEKTQFSVNDATASVLFPAAAAGVQSTIYVATQGNYLVRGTLDLTATGGSASSSAASPTTAASPVAAGANSTVTIDVTQVGSAPAITAPTAGTPTP